MWQREPGRGRYAQPERERRYLLRSLPEEVADPVEIEDRYIAHTRLRLRRMSDGTGAATHKLAQKVPDAADPSLGFLTNTYLSGEEYEALLVLPALVLSKTRYRVPGSPLVAVDRFHGALAGLVLAEVALDREDGAATLAPPFPALDVTADRRFTGGELARTTAQGLRRLLASAGATWAG